MCVRLWVCRDTNTDVCVVVGEISSHCLREEICHSAALSTLSTQILVSDTILQENEPGVMGKWLVPALAQESYRIDLEYFVV